VRGLIGRARYSWDSQQRCGFQEQSQQQDDTTGSLRHVLPLRPRRHSPPAPYPCLRNQPRKIEVSISHSTRCLEVVARFTDTGRTRLAPAWCVTNQVSNSPGLLVAKPNNRLNLPSATSEGRLTRSSPMTK